MSTPLPAVSGDDHRSKRARFADAGEASRSVLQRAAAASPPLHWHEFLQCLERAGFRGSKMVSGQNAILYSYALWLVGRVDYQVPMDRLKEVVARWFFMAHTTSRYSGSFETRFEADVARLAAVELGDADGFVATLDQVINDTLTADYWAITLPNELATSAAKSPALLAYIAALNIHDADCGQGILGTTCCRRSPTPPL